MKRPRLILFDIDGTLIRTQNGFVPFNDAILKTFGIAGDIRTVIPDGNTDPLILEEIFTAAGNPMDIPEEKWRSFADNLHDCYSQAIREGKATVQRLPGALELVEALGEAQAIYQGIVTGNLKVIAQTKLETAGLSAYLDLGAYGSDSPHRIDLPAIAKKRWEEKTGRPIMPEQCIIVGDTPKDLAAARKNDMRCLLVGTGRYPAEELSLLQPDACLPDFTDTKLAIEILLS